MRKFIIFVLLIMIFNSTQTWSQEGISFYEDTISVVRDGSRIFGSIIIPHTNPNKAVVLIIAGSGPTDRNGNNPMMTNNSLKMLAESLATSGIASVRYDKRGIGESVAAGAVEIDLRFDDYVADASKWIAYLYDDVRFDRVIVIGHSEGSLIGMIATQKSENTGFISIAGPGEPADLLLKRQLNTQPQFIQDQIFPMIDSLKAGHILNKVDPAYNALFRPGVQPYLISWFKYDPGDEIQKLKVPILIIQGKTDIQVRLEDAELLKKAAPAARLEILEGMNHIMKPASNDRQENIATYRDPALPIDSIMVSIIVDFIKNIP